jgi:hypothetical protein
MSATAADVRRMRAIAAVLVRHDVRPVWRPGWETRGTGQTFDPRGLVCHWDASTILSGEWGALGVIEFGRGGDNPVPGPLAQFQGARCLDGIPKVAMVAAGRANGAGAGGPYRLPNGVVVPKDSGNRYFLNAEWAWAGDTEELNPAAKHAYSALGYAVREVLS